jgi:MFS family permease
VSELAPVAAKAATPASGPALLRPFAVRDFRLMFGGETISVLGDQFHFVALAWLTLQLTGSGLALGGVLMVAAIPRAVLMLVGGALSDRLSPRDLMLASNGVRAVLVAIIAALVLTGQVALWHLFVLAAIFGVVDALFYPATSAILPMLVEEKLLPPANALIQGSQQLTGLIGPALAGVVVAAVNTGPAFAFDAVSFAVAAAALVFVTGGRRRAVVIEGTSAGGEGLLSTIGVGLRYVWADPAVRALVLIAAAFNFAFTGPLSVGIPYMAVHRFDGGPAAFGILFAGFGAGALLGALAAGAIPRVPRLGSVVLGVGVALGVAMGSLGVAPTVPLALGMLAAMGLGVGFINVHLVSWLQARTPEEMRGRVMSTVMLSSVGLAPISFAVAGAIVDFGAISWLFIAAGGIVLAASLIGFASGVAGRMSTEQAPA